MASVRAWSKPSRIQDLARNLGKFPTSGSEKRFSGLDLMRQLSAKHGLRGIGLSGFGMDSDLAQSVAAGFSRHLIKPIDIGQLGAVLTEMAAGA